MYDEMVARKYELLTLDADTVFTTTAATYTIDTTIKPRRAIVGPVETQAVRMTIHGVDPVVLTKLGMLLSTGDTFIVDGPRNVANIKLVREAAVTAYVPITYLY